MDFFLAFFLLTVGCTIAEAVWLNRKGWADFKKSLAFSGITNFLGLCAGCFITAVIILGTLFVILSGEGKSLSPGSSRLKTILIIAAITTPLMLFVCKRIFLAILKMQGGAAAWFYSLVSALLIVLVSMGVPLLLKYF